MFYQTKEQKPLSFKEFEAMAKANPDGMGYMANINGHTVYKKGFFDVNEFYHVYRNLMNNPNLVDIACHFRIGTGSNVDKANCHPFPITSNKSRLKKTEGKADVTIMMNGIIGKSTKEFSDTAIYTMTNLKDYYDWDNRFFLNFTRTQEMLFENEIHGVRFIIMSKDGTRLFGNGWSDYDNKCKVSNRNWLYRLEGYQNNYYNQINAYYDYNKAKRFATKQDTKHKSYIDYLLEGVVG